MSIDALLTGKLMNQPTQRTSKNGNPFTVCRIRVAGAGAGESDSLLANCIAFAEPAQAALLALAPGEAVAVAGSLKVGTWTTNDGTTKPSLDVTASAVLSTYSVAKKRKAAQSDQDDRHQEQRPTHDAWLAGAPAGRGARDQRQQQPPQRAGLADDLDDGADLPF